MPSTWRDWQTRIRSRNHRFTQRNQWKSRKQLFCLPFRNLNSIDFTQLKFTLEYPIQSRIFSTAFQIYQQKLDVIINELKRIQEYQHEHVECHGPQIVSNDTKNQSNIHINFPISLLPNIQNIQQGRPIKINCLLGFNWHDHILRLMIMPQSNKTTIVIAI